MVQLPRGGALGVPPLATTSATGALLAANLGDDADTTAAIYGQLAGAYYGADGIPAKWRERLTAAAEITSLADSLHEHAREAQSAGPQPRGPS